MIKTYCLLFILLLPIFLVAQKDKTTGLPVDQEELKQVISEKDLKEGDIVTVYTQFKVDGSGKIYDISTRGTDKIFENEALRILLEMPEITSEKIKGSAAGTKFTLPVKFMIKDEKGAKRLQFLR